MQHSNSFWNFEINVLIDFWTKRILYSHLYSFSYCLSWLWIKKSKTVVHNTLGVSYCSKSTFYTVALKIFYACLDLQMTQGYQGIRAACPWIPRNSIKLRWVFIQADGVMKFCLCFKFTETSFAEYSHISNKLLRELQQQPDELRQKFTKS